MFGLLAFETKEMLRGAQRAPLVFLEPEKPGSDRVKKELRAYVAAADGAEVNDGI